MREHKPVNFSVVKLNGGFWGERLETVLDHTIPSQYAQLVSHGMLEAMNLPMPAPELRIPRNVHGFTTQIFWDSDIGKWIEAASYALSHRRDENVEAQIDAITAQLEKAQAPDGYLNCWYLGREPQNRWTNLRDNHELYNAGHMLEGAIAYFQATGRRKLLDVFERYMDHIAEMFGTGPNQRRGYPGHQEIELALIKLYHLTGDRKRLDLATYFINERGRQPHYFDAEREARGEAPRAFHQATYEYNQSHIPVREQTKVVGHAVRAMYMYAAMADLAADLDDAALKSACETLWRDLTETRMYVTGGFGPSASNEGFTTDFDLPNDTAYAETCASVAMVFWAQRMLNLELDAKYADMLELALYNNSLAGLSRDGTQYFYDNKLESDGTHQRWDWHPCPCCTMNVARLVASVAGYFYSSSHDGFAVHLYGGTTASIPVGAQIVTVEEVSDYPWSGAVTLTISPEQEAAFAVRLRIPSWAKGAKAEINGTPIDVAGQTERGYLKIERTWQQGDRIGLTLPMTPERLYAHPDVNADAQRVALRRGPLVYCAEQIDNPDLPLRHLRLPGEGALHELRHPDLPGGVMAVRAEAEMLQTADWRHALYRTSPPKSAPATLTAVPYYIWCNRGPNEMQVWLRE